MSIDLLQFINKFSFTIFKEHFLHNLLVFLYIIYNTECCCFSLVVLILSRFPYRQCQPPSGLLNTSTKVNLICTPADTQLRRGSRSRFESSAGSLSLIGHVNTWRVRLEVKCTLSHTGSGGLCSSTDRNEEWALKSEKGAPGLPPWAAEPSMKQSLAATNLVQATEDGDRDADEGQSPLSCTHKPHKHWLAHWLKGWVVLRYFWYWCHFFGRWRYWYLKRYKKVLFNAKFNFLSLNQAKKLNLFFFL